MRYSHHLADGITIVGGPEGFGVTSNPDELVLINPVYTEVLPVDLQEKMLLVFELKSGRPLIGIFSVKMRKWLHRPIFTLVRIVDPMNFLVYIGNLKGRCNITTGAINWFTE